METPLIDALFDLDGQVEGRQSVHYSLAVAVLSCPSLPIILGGQRTYSYFVNLLIYYLGWLRISLAFSARGRVCKLSTINLLTENECTTTTTV